MHNGKTVQTVVYSRYIFPNNTQEINAAIKQGIPRKNNVNIVHITKNAPINGSVNLNNTLCHGFNDPF